MTEDLEKAFNSILTLARDWYATASSDENLLVYISGLAIIAALSVLVAAIRRKRTSRSKPGNRLRENMKKMREEAPYKKGRR